MKKFTKNIVKEFKTGFGRFIAIMAIIALGVGFLIGVMQATPDMENTMDGYLRQENAYDVDVKGTVGLTEADLAALAGLGQVESVMPVISSDAVVHVGEKNVVGRVFGLEDVSSPQNLSRLTLLEGRWPQGSGEEGVAEAVALRPGNKLEPVVLGQEVALPAAPTTANSSYGDIYRAKTLRVVGIVSSPDYYYDDSREVTNLGTGVVGCILYANTADVYKDLREPASLADLLGGGATVFGALNFSADEQDRVVCTDAWVKIAGAEGHAMFGEGYKSYVLGAVSALEELGDARSEPVNEKLEALAGMQDGMQGGAGGAGGTLPAARAVQGAGVSARSASAAPETAQASWMILDRASKNVSYVSFDLNVEKVEDIAGIFPVFFIFVAALVALTSMTRMVEEDRMQIGTLKALGYGNARILSKYLLYCCLASLIGCVAGILIGFSLLPSIFWQAYRTLYYLPQLSLAFSPWFAVAVVGIALAGTALVTWGAGRPALKERPSVLMQPKAPKPGKRILLERCNFFWKHLKFKWKATIRNIFRYKKNMILTVVSVMGCTALILVGFGLNDSILSATDIQYEDVILYDSVVEYSGGLDDIRAGEGSALQEFLSGAEGWMSLYGENGQLVLHAGTEEEANESVELYLVEDAEQFSSFVSLHERRGKDPIDVTAAASPAVVLPENIAVVYGIGEGDTVTYVSGGTSVQATVYGVCENYTGSYLYMSRAGYLELFGQDADVAHNMLFVRSGVSEADAPAQTEALLADGSGRVTSVEFVYAGIETFEGLESTMGLVITVLVISAGGLAAIVLYNLTNINIDERRREIATLRVLGYRKGEVAGYIYRESAILTLFGALLGLLLGFLLHIFITSRVNSVSMMLGRAIGGLSYLWAFLLTVAFAAVVYAFMLIKLNRINMADSLKSNE